MRSRGVFVVINHFPKSVHQAFDDFIQSPYHNRQSDLIQLWRTLRDHLLSDPNAELSPEEFMGLFRPDWDFSRTWTNYLNVRLSSLLKLFQEFLVIEGLKENPMLHHRLLLDAYVKGRVFDRVPNQYKKGHRQIEGTIEKGAEFYRDAFEFEYEMGNYYFRNPRGPLDLESFFSEVNYYLDTYYFTRKMEMANTIHHFASMFPQDFQVSQLEFVRQGIENGNSDFPPLTQLNHDFYRLRLQPDNFDHYLRVKALLFDSLDELTPESRFAMASFLLNNCNKNINLGNEPYMQEADELNDFLLNSGFLLQNDLLNPGLLKNIITIKCFLGKTDHSKKILSTYRNRLTDAHEGYAVMYIEGLIKFYESDFEACTHLMDQVLVFREDVFYGWDARNLMMKCALEIALRVDSPEEIDRQIRNFYLFMDRSKQLKGSRTKHNRNSLRLARKLVRFLFTKNVRDPAVKYHKLKTEIREAVPLTLIAKKWLLEKLEQHPFGPL